MFDTLAVSAADYECGLRAMNVIHTKQRASFLLDTISASLFSIYIYVLGPPSLLFVPTKYVNAWLQNG